MLPPYNLLTIKAKFG